MMCFFARIGEGKVEKSGEAEEEEEGEGDLNELRLWSQLASFL